MNKIRVYIRKIMQLNTVRFDCGNIFIMIQSQWFGKMCDALTLRPQVSPAEERLPENSIFFSQQENNADAYH